MNPEDPDLFDELIGDRRPLGIGVSSQQFRDSYIEAPSLDDLMDRGYSSNPRNAYGDWYEDEVQGKVSRICDEKGWSFTTHVNLGDSKIYKGSKVVDILIAEELGLELKYLKGTGSLVDPKSVIDAIDFTDRPVYCLYCIDGPGWLKGRHVEYLGKWWDFTCFGFLEETLDRFFSLPADARV